MISFIKGKVIANNGAEMSILTAGGVGYKIAYNPANADKWPIGSEAEILTHLVAREDTLDLYGLASESEKELFIMFLSVSGIGPKTALHLLSLGAVSEINRAIGRGDIEYLTKVSGIGRKIAERILVELKSKIKNFEFNNNEREDSGALSDVIDGLVAMGYSVSDARETVKKIDARNKTREQLIKEALKTIK
ncbi:MAG: Holliday junction branch migration protein RuvA [Patescibacteria group bacterium]|nr:Holliday junction branch migration protein RuvA [Patescibacteria group bacterium]